MFYSSPFKAALVIIVLLVQGMPLQILPANNFQEESTTASASASVNSSHQTPTTKSTSPRPAAFNQQLQNVINSDCPTCGIGDINCDNVHRCTQSCGQIKSINYPANYNNNHRCRWSIRAPDNGYYVNLTIIDFDIPSASNASKLGTCIFDYLTLIDGYTGKRLGCYCNENLPPTFVVSPWNELIIQFDTNSETTGRGFYFKYKFMRLELTEKIQKQMKPSSQNGGAINQSNQQSAMSYANTNSNNIIINHNNNCLKDWIYFRGSCYKAYNELEPLQWYDAENRCNYHGEGLDGHLISILDEDEMLVVLYLLTNVWKSIKHQDYYIGLIDVSREGVYRWSDNNPMSYTDWELKPILLEEEITPAQPDGGAYEDCTIIRYNSFWRTSNWHDVPCSLGKHYHSHLEKATASINYNVHDYVNSYICKSDSISTSSSSISHHSSSMTTSQQKVRKPLFSVIIPPIHGNLIHHLAGPVLTTTTTPSTPAASSNAVVIGGNTVDSSLLNLSSKSINSINPADFDSDLAVKRRKFYLSTLDDNRYFVCDNLEVISVVLKCDGVAHCRDGSDESDGCDQDCLDWQFKCANGRCISIGNYCNFVDDCGDGSDESRCERHRCKLNEFRCQSGQCIPNQQRCDLLPDCSDSSDEGRLCTIGSNCNSVSTFQCYNGNCIPQYAVCDFQIDCPGKFHEDEDPATCEVILKSRFLDYKLYPTLSSLVGQNSNQLMMLESNRLTAVSNSSTLIQQFSWAKQNLFRCRSGNLIDNNLRCLYEFDRYGFQIGCRDVTHLIGCEDFECPQRDYVKCSNSYCIPWRYICDGKWDCIMGDDEVGCARYVCPGQYKCLNQSSCILLHQLCDGHRQCPMGDDEWFCDLQCPQNCDCIGQSVNCQSANLTFLPSNFISKSVRKLDLSFNKLGPNLSSSDFSTFHDLGELILHHNGIEVLIPRKFHALRNLYRLDLSNNQIHSVKRGAFAGLRRVTQLLLESNPELVILEPEAFLGLSSLQMLNISSSRITSMRKNTFDGLTSLRYLLLRNNMILEIEDGSFRSLNSLVTLDMRGNDIRYFTKSIFNDLKSLRNLSTDSFKFCCLMRQQIPSDRCLPLPDEISDCEDLLSSRIQTWIIWIAGIFAFLGNLIVIIWRVKWSRRVAGLQEGRLIDSNLLLSLAFSDSLMGIYLTFIAIADTVYRGRYIENADNWRESVLCNFCGFLVTISSQVSVLTLVTIALHRYNEICLILEPKNKFELSLKWTRKLIAIFWFAAFLIALIPFVMTQYFKGQFYARSGVCLAFHYTNNQKGVGWLYSFIVFLCLKMFALVAIVYCYTRISLVKFNDEVLSNQSNESTKPNQIKIVIIILTHFAAWLPMIIIEFLSLFGVPIPTIVYSWIAVTVLPINSAINPLIYTIPSIKKWINELIKRNHQNHSLEMKENKSATERNLDQKNIPPGYTTLKQYIKQCPDEELFIQIAIAIAKGFEPNYAARKVFKTLTIEHILITDKLKPIEGQNEDFARPVVYIPNQDNNCRRIESKCSKSSPLTGNTQQFQQQQQPNRQLRYHHHEKNCECADVFKFGEILFKLIQLYKNEKLDQSEGA